MEAAEGNLNVDGHVARRVGVEVPVQPEVVRVRRVRLVGVGNTVMRVANTVDFKRMIHKVSLRTRHLACFNQLVDKAGIVMAIFKKSEQGSISDFVSQFLR